MWPSWYRPPRVIFHSYWVSAWKLFPVITDYASNFLFRYTPNNTNICYCSYNYNNYKVTVVGMAEGQYVRGQYCSIALWHDILPSRRVMCTSRDVSWTNHIHTLHIYDYVLPMFRRSWCLAQGRNSAIVVSLQPDQDYGTVCRGLCVNPRQSQLSRDT